MRQPAPSPLALPAADRPLLGILLMLGFCLLAPLGDGLAKLAGAEVSVAFLLVVRFGAQVLLLWPVVLARKLVWRMSPRILRLTALRAILHIAGIGMMFTAVRYLPLADAIAIAFVMPFIMLLLGKYVLAEAVGPRRLIACAVGFVGTLMVVQPSFAAVGAPALLPLGVAVVFALFMLVTRHVAKEVDPITLQATSGLIALPLVLLGGTMFWGPEGFTPPQSDAIWGILLLIGVLGTGAHLLMTWSLRFAPSATLAPMQYLEIPFATVIGFLLFGDWPNGLAAAGILVTIATGLYIVYREQVTARTGRRLGDRATLPADSPDP